MLTNAAITRIDRQLDVDATGRLRRAVGDDVSVRCALDMISGRQRYTLGAILEDATQVIYIEKSVLEAQDESMPANGDQLMILADGSNTAYTVTIITTGDRIAPSGRPMSHLELFVKREAA